VEEFARLEFDETAHSSLCVKEMRSEIAGKLARTCAVLEEIKQVNEAGMQRSRAEKYSVTTSIALLVRL
jgi:hypothetical protein